jgi:DNA-binding winged helix-turn-helix (wHTH) protein
MKQNRRITTIYEHGYKFGKQKAIINLGVQAEAGSMV